MIFDEHSEITRAARQWITYSAASPTRYDGVNQLIGNELRSNGATGITLLSGRRATLAGWLQESTAWDLIALQYGAPILAVTYAGERTDRVLGVARDTQLAQTHGIVPANLRRAHVHVQEGTGPLLDQAAAMCGRLRDSGLYHMVWAIGVTREPAGFAEPSPAVGWDRFASGLRSAASRP